MSYVKAIKLQQTRIDQLEAERDRLRAEKAELFDLVKRAGIHARHCPNCSEYILGIVKEARADLAKTELSTPEREPGMAYPGLKTGEGMG